MKREVEENKFVGVASDIVDLLELCGVEGTGTDAGTIASTISSHQLANMRQNQKLFVNLELTPNEKVPDEMGADCDWHGYG